MSDINTIKARLKADYEYNQDPVSYLQAILANEKEEILYSAASQLLIEYVNDHKPQRDTWEDLG